MLKSLVCFLIFEMDYKEEKHCERDPRKMKIALTMTRVTIRRIKSGLECFEGNKVQGRQRKREIQK